MILDRTMVDRGAGCDTWRSWIEMRLDAEGEHGEMSERLDAHLVVCGACRAYRSDVLRVRKGLRAVPLHPLPATTLRQLRSIARDETDPGCLRRAFAPTRVRAAMAAAAVLALTTAALWFVNGVGVGGGGPSEAELAQLDRDLQTVLAQLGRAFASAERIAVNDVLIGETAPLIRHMPLSRLDESNFIRRTNP